jgi:hypothetical protein
MSVDESPFTTSFVPFTVLPACGTALSGGVAAAPRPVPRPMPRPVPACRMRPPPAAHTVADDHVLQKQVGIARWSARANGAALAIQGALTPRPSTAFPLPVT